MMSLTPAQVKAIIAALAAINANMEAMVATLTELNTTLGKLL